MISGSSDFEIWTPPDPNPQYIMQIMLSGDQNFNSGDLWALPSSYSSSQQSINSTKFKRVDPQYDDFLGAAVTRRRRPQLLIIIIIIIIIIISVIEDACGESPPPPRNHHLVDRPA